MLATFFGGGEIINAYEAGLSRPDIDLIAVKSALGASATEAVKESAAIEDPDEAISRLQDVLHNEIPLDDAEALIPAWASANLPEDFRVFGALESPIKEIQGITVTHFDVSAMPHKLTRDIGTIIHGPLAISIGVAGNGTFRGLRFPHRLTDEQLFGYRPTPELDAFEKAHTAWGLFNPNAEVTSVDQNPGDIILVPCSPQPTLHGVEVAKDVERASVISSYVVTPHPWVTASELRHLRIAEKEFEERWKRALRVQQNLS